MSVQITIELPESAFSTLQSSPEVFVKEMRLAAATKWYEIGRVSQSKAAELAGISHQAFIEALPRFKVTPLQTTPEELAREWAEAQQPTQLTRNQIAGQDFIKKARGMLKGTSSLTQAMLKARAEEREQEESNLPTPPKSKLINSEA